MQPIIYDVAVSADGFIAGAGNDISAFPHEGRAVDDYLARLSGYKTVLMGRATYEFGYGFGLEPGQNPYLGAQSIVVSRRIDLPPSAEVQIRRELDVAWLEDLRRDSPSPVYLCGGGVLATALHDLGQLHRLRLKRAPILLGRGVPLFAALKSLPKLALKDQTDYGDGYLFQDFAIL